MLVLGLCFGHDGSAAVVRDGKLIAAIASERLTRFKKQRGVTRETLRYVLEKANVRLNEIDVAIIANWHWDLIDDKIELTDKVGQGFSLNHVEGQSWTRDHWMAWNRQNEPFSPPLVLSIDGHRLPALAVDHELAHGAYAYFCSPFDDAIALSVDGADGLSSTHGIYAFSEKMFSVQPSVCIRRNDTFAVGDYYGMITDFIGFYPSLTDAGKVMALAAFGKPVEGVEHIKGNNPDDVFKGDMYIHTLFRAGIRRFPFSRSLFPQLKGEGGMVDPAWLDKKDWASPLSTTIAATAQHILEREMLGLCELIARDLRSFSRNLVLAGGTALNCVCNGKILNSGLFENVFLAPASGDDGLCIGGALLASSRLFKNEKGTLAGWKNLPKQLHTPLEVFEGGRRYSDTEIRQAIDKVGNAVVARKLDEPSLLREVVDAIEAGKIVGWFYRGSELGPRALGHRSLIADPRRPDMKDILNLRVKHREPFRPFAPVIPIEYAHDWFDIPKNSSSPFMLFSVKCHKPEMIPSAVHIDNTARLQTVDEANNDRFYRLVKSFGERTGVPVVLNTSFNVQGEPIVETPDDAIRCFRGTNIDLLVLEDWLLTKAG